MKFLLPLLLFMIAVSPSSRAQTPGATVEQDLKTLMQTEYAAGMRNDVTTISRIWADEYVSTGPKGETTTKSQMLSYYKHAPVSQTKFGPVALSDVKIQVYNDVALMTGRATGTLPNGKMAGASLRFTRLHIKRNGQWVVVANHLSRVEPEPKKKT